MKTIFYKRVKYCFHHEKIEFISSSHRVIFFLLYSFNAKSGKWRHPYLHYCNSVIYARSFIDDANFETADGQVPHWWSEYIIVQSFTCDLTSFSERRRSGKPARGPGHTRRWSSCSVNTVELTRAARHDTGCNNVYQSNKLSRRVQTVIWYEVMQETRPLEHSNSEIIAA